jgi:hypothetical protein
MQEGVVGSQAEARRVMSNGHLTNRSSSGSGQLPRRLPAAVIDTLNKATNAVLAEPAAKNRFTELGAILLPGSPADFGRLLADETEKWGKVVKFSGAKVD